MNIYPFPTHDNNNPFLWELYRRIDGVAPTPLWQISKPGIIHIHWSSQLYGSRFLLKSIASLATNFFRLWYLKQHGCKIIWTMHNLSAHDFPHPWIDWMGRKFLFVLSDAIIIQQKSAQESLSRRFPRKRIVHIPLGNYIGLYGNWYSQEHRDIVLLSFGLVRPYKKIDEIIRVVRQSGQNIQLRIVGKATETYAKILQKIYDPPRVSLFVKGFTIEQHAHIHVHPIYKREDMDVHVDDMKNISVEEMKIVAAKIKSVMNKQPII